MEESLIFKYSGGVDSKNERKHSHRRNGDKNSDCSWQSRREDARRSWNDGRSFRASARFRAWLTRLPG